MYLASVPLPVFEGSDQYDFYASQLPNGYWLADAYDRGTENKVGRLIYRFNDETNYGYWEEWTDQDQYFFDLWSGALAGIGAAVLFGGGDEPAPAPPAPVAQPPEPAPAPTTPYTPDRFVYSAPDAAAPVPADSGSEKIGLNPVRGVQTVVRLRLPPVRQPAPETEDPEEEPPMVGLNLPQNPYVIDEDPNSGSIPGTIGQILPIFDRWFFPWPQSPDAQPQTAQPAAAAAQPFPLWAVFFAGIVVGRMSKR